MSAPTESVESSDKKIVKISNQEIFDAMEATGYNVEDYLTKEEINQAREEKDQFTIEIDQSKVNDLSSGKDNGMVSIQSGYTGFTRVNDTRFNIHLNSVLTSLLLATGAGAVTGALMTIPAFAIALSGVGASSGALTAFLGSAVTMIGSATNGISIAGQTYIRSTALGIRTGLRVKGVYL